MHLFYLQHFFACATLFSISFPHPPFLSITTHNFQGAFIYTHPTIRLISPFNNYYLTFSNIHTQLAYSTHLRKSTHYYTQHVLIFCNQDGIIVHNSPSFTRLIPLSHRSLSLSITHHQQAHWTTMATWYISLLYFLVFYKSVITLPSNLLVHDPHSKLSYIFLTALTTPNHHNIFSPFMHALHIYKLTLYSSISQ